MSENRIHDRKGITIRKGDRVVLNGTVTQIFETVEGNNNVLLQIEAPRGEYAPQLVVAGVAVERLESNSGAEASAALAGAGSNR